MENNASNIVIDELNQVRLVSPDLAEDSTHLSDETTKFVDKFSRFNELVESIAQMMTELGNVADAERLRAMSIQNAAKQTENQRLEEAQQLKILVHEKQVELERLKVELQELQRLELQQNEFLQKLRLPL
uniref:Intraflagellar transport protein 20 n=1 Tax=Panagrolaimus sp. JU765 TaxID=591449 RepID=A0AC34Q5W9_9BILA